MKFLVSTGFVASVVAFASWSMMWFLITQPRANEWSEDGVGATKIDFLIRTQASYSSQLGVILGVVAAALYIVFIHIGHVATRFRRFAIAIIMAAPFAYIINVLCAGLSNAGVQAVFVTGIFIPLTISLYAISFFLRQRHKSTGVPPS